MIMQAVVFNPGMGLHEDYARMVEAGVCGNPMHVNEFYSVVGTTADQTTFMEKAAKRLKIMKGDFVTGPAKHVWCKKLIVHKCGGPDESIFSDDPVSMLAGGVSLWTFHYEGPGIPRNIFCHMLDMFKTDSILTVSRNSTTDIIGVPVHLIEF